MRYLRLLLFPFSLLYGLAIALRHWLYDHDWLRRTAVDIPTIVVGNLAVGGTGKSPMVEYLVRLLGPDYRIAVLSRGYGRRTKGFREVQTDDQAPLTGDEPLQIKRKFPHITVAVCESRVEGIHLLQNRHDLVLLDDAFQHRSLIPGFSILLFDFKTTWQDPHLLLPAGNYRDLLSRRRHADVMIVTKTPKEPTDRQRNRIANKLSTSSAPLLYSYIQYDGIVPMHGTGNQTVDAQTPVLIVTGIANPTPFVEYVHQRHLVFDHIAFPDHHAFTERDIDRIGARFGQLGGAQKIIITTEKDTMRLYGFIDNLSSLGIAVHYVPIRTAFNPSDRQELDGRIKQYLQSARGKQVNP